MQSDNPTCHEALFSLFEDRRSDALLARSYLCSSGEGCRKIDAHVSIQPRGPPRDGKPYQS